MLTEVTIAAATRRDQAAHCEEAGISMRKYGKKSRFSYRSLEYAFTGARTSQSRCLSGFEKSTARK
jgi:lambda repressor-like predicted transcriptional regulator